LDYRTATYITIKEKFVSFRVKNTDTSVLKTVLQQQKTVTREIVSQYIWKQNKEIIQWSFLFLLS